MKRLLPAAAVGLGVCLLLSGPAGAQYAGGLTLSATSAPPGGEVTVSGDGFEPGTTVSITFESAPVLLETTEAGASGSISETVTIPRDAAPGEHTITASGSGTGGGMLVLSGTITVRGGGLAFTGSNILLFGVIGIGLVAVGSGLWIGQRRLGTRRDQP